MGYKATVLNVMIASPNDVPDERKIACEVVYDWNNIHSQSRKIVLLPLTWENNVSPELGTRPQEIVNQKILKRADILIGIFWNRVGSPTEKFMSGSVEEIEGHIDAGKTALLYFSEKLSKAKELDQSQVTAVKNMEVLYRSKGITAKFDSNEDFREKFSKHLALKLNENRYLEISDDVSESNSEKSLHSILTNLYPESQLILKETARDKRGTLMRLSHTTGTTFQTNDKDLNEDDSPRTLAKFNAAIEQLISLKLISGTGSKGQLFNLTDLGFEIADELNNSEG